MNPAPGRGVLGWSGVLLGATALLATLLSGLSGCSGERNRVGQESSRKARHLILVTLDTLRADHVGIYGGSVETPRLDAIARRGALVEQAVAHAPLTRPSHVSLLSGRLPFETGVRDNVAPVAVPEVPLLAEVLKQAGFQTAAFVSSVVLSAGSGIDRGFDLYSDDIEPGAASDVFLSRAQRRGDRTLAEAITWLERNRDADRLFLWLHLYDPHDPYEPPQPWASRYADRPYAGEVAWTDDLVGRLEDRLAKLGLAESSLLIATSDHGEGLGDHGELLHGFFVYESTLRVPLVLAGPGIAPDRRIAGPIGLIDLYPTLLDLLGIAAPSSASSPSSAKSFAPALAEESKRGSTPAYPAPVYAESLVPLLHFGWSDLRVIRRGNLKYIQAPRPELYDLDQDPNEQDNLLERQRPIEARELQRTLEMFLDRERVAMTQEGSEETGAISGELLERLGALGYLGGATPAETPTPGADPKDKIQEFRIANDLMRRGLEQLHAGEHEDSVLLFEQVLERGIESAELHLYLAKAKAALGRPAEATHHFTETVLRTPVYTEAWIGLAKARAEQGDAAGALAAFREGQKALPNSAALYREEGRLLRLLRRPEEARLALQEAITRDPDDGFSHAALGEMHRALGDHEQAVAELRQAVELAPEEPSYWNSLGMTLGGDELVRDEAEAAFRRAWELDPTNHRYAYNLGLVLLQQGRSEEARRLFSSSLALAPDFSPARERLAEIDASVR